MTPEKQAAAICVALYEEETMPKETELNVAIDKNAHIVIPRKEKIAHVAADLIISYAKYGFPADCSPNWTKEHIEAAIFKGPHPSAHVPAALQALLNETDDKVQNGYPKVMGYGDIMHALPSKLKIPPVAMIPHKSRSFRTILDLSFQLRHRGKLMESVNSARVKMAPVESMIQLGHCV